MTVFHHLCGVDTTPDPEPSTPFPHNAEHQPKPTFDGEPFPSMIHEPRQSRETEQRITPDIELNLSDQLQELATVPTAREQSMNSENGLPFSSPPMRDSVPKPNKEWPLSPEGSPVSLEAHEYPAICSLLLPPSLSSGSSSACPQPTINKVQAPQVCHPPASPWL